MCPRPCDHPAASESHGHTRKQRSGFESPIGARFRYICSSFIVPRRRKKYCPGWLVDRGQTAVAYILKQLFCASSSATNRRWIALHSERVNWLPPRSHGTVRNVPRPRPTTRGMFFGSQFGGSQNAPAQRCAHACSGSPTAARSLVYSITIGSSSTVLTHRA